MAVLHLVQSGRLDLDADVNQYLKAWKIPASGFTEQNKVTLRELLSHTAGMTVHGFPGYAAGSPVPTLVQVLDGAAPANSAITRNRMDSCEVVKISTILVVRPRLGACFCRSSISVPAAGG